MSTTIAAISTALSPAGISVIRISGDDAIQIADNVFRSDKKSLREMPGYTCAFGGAFHHDRKIDEVIASVFRAPHSYTGEDVVELSCHGGVAVTREILRLIYSAGAVPAAAGEFTKRAFLNGKLNLIEAESVMSIISADSAEQARAAVDIKDGHLSRRINTVKSSLLHTAAHLNAWADYPEEDIPEVTPDAICASLTAAENDLRAILKGYDDGKLLGEGVNTVIIGKPNVGKSTLMNLLSGYDKSIVTSIPGTTRDVIEERINLGGFRLNLIDTAGIRETADEIERIGVDRARQKLSAASLIICVFDSSQPQDIEDEAVLSLLNEAVPAIAIYNKSDLGITHKPNGTLFRSTFTISAKNSSESEREAFITGLEQALSAIFMGDERYDTASALVYNERQRSLTERALTAVNHAYEATVRGETLDAVTIAIEDAIELLCELTGERVTDEVVDRVFHSFCVGK